MTTNASDSCAAKLRVLSDPTRLEVMHLVCSKPRLVGELVEALGVEQSLLSHHLRVLRDAGFLDSASEGPFRRYFVVSELTHEGSLDLGCCQIAFHDQPH